MRRDCSLFLGLGMLLLGGCLPVPISDPKESTIDPALEGTWLAPGLELAQCMHGGIEYGPGTQKTIYLVKAFDEHCYLIAAVDYYHARDGRIGLFGSGGPSLSWWKGWLVPVGERRYLVCQPLPFTLPGDSEVVRSRGAFYPTFELSRAGEDSFRVALVVFPDMIHQLDAAGTDEARKAVLAKYTPESLRKRIQSNPAAAAPGDPRPLTVHRMTLESEKHVQRVLETLGIADADPNHLPERLRPPEANRAR